MIIELVGLPGVGKTTIAKGLEQLGVARIVIGGRAELLRYNIKFILRYPISALRTFFWLVRYRGNREFWYTKFMNLYLIHNAKFMKAHEFDRAVIDQGHHQNILSLFDDAVSREMLSEYLKILPKPDLLVYVSLEEEERMERLKKRGYAVRDGADPELLKRWQSASITHNDLLREMREEMGCAIETITPQDLEQKIVRVSNARIWNFVLHARMPTEKAHGLQTAKTIEALALEGEYVLLTVPKRSNPITKSFNEYYKLRAPISIRYISAPNLLRFSRYVGGVAFVVDAAIFLSALFIKRKDRYAYYYTRNPEIAWMYSVLGARTLYEAHVWPMSKTTLYTYLLKKVSAIVANSEGTATQYKENKFSNVHVVRNGVDLLGYKTALSLHDARQRLNLSLDEKIVLYVGAFYEWKGVPVLIKAWRHALDKVPYQLILVGGEVSDLSESAKEDFLETKRIRLIAHIPNQEVAAYLQAADLLVLPNAPTSTESVLYTSPIKMFEYMASGRPIIASDLPSIREVLNERNATFVPAGNYVLLAEEIEKYFSAPSTYESKAIVARNESMQYSWTERAHKLIAIAQGITYSP